MADEILDGLSELQQSQGISDGSAALANFGRHFVLLELKLLDELRVTLRFLHGIEVLALKIFDERQFKDRAIVGFADDNGDLGQTEQLGGAPAAFTGDQLQMTIQFTDDERLDDALFFD